VTVRVLYIHHAGAFGGASRSLLELIKAFPDTAIEGHLVTQHGEVATLARKAGMGVVESHGIAQFDHTRYGHYRGRRWMLLLREIAYLAPTFLALLKARRRWPDIALVHINEITLLPAILASKFIFRCPVIVHVRSLQFANTGSLRSRFLFHQLRRVDAVIAIDETVRRSLPSDLKCEVIHNGLSVASSDRRPQAQASPLRIGMVGNLLAFKGVYDFIEAARICKTRGMHVKFVIYGRNTRPHTGVVSWLFRVTGFSRDIERDLQHALKRSGLEDMVELAGFNPDLKAVYESMDVLCFPSHLDAPGRPVFEAAFWRVPCIVAVQHPTLDTLVPGETGIAITPYDPSAIADAIAHFYHTPGEVSRMGENARTLAMKNFNARDNAAKILAVYRRILAAHGATNSCAS
jgi:glycosyltransferase involved in cell wall biosynthesis